MTDTPSEDPMFSLPSLFNEEANDETVPPVCDQLKCSFRSCKVNGAMLRKCSNPKCTRMIHLVCYQLLGRKYNIPTNDGNEVFCTKTCLTRMPKPTSGGHQNNERTTHQELQIIGAAERITWTEEEMEVLIKWITTEGNYAYYRGNTDGVKKKHIVQMLSLKLSEVSPVPRSLKQITNKIHHLENSYRKAYNFQFKETGAGLKENNPASFHDALLNICPYYDHLNPIMSDRAGTAPPYSTDSIADEDLIGFEMVVQRNDEENTSAVVAINEQMEELNGEDHDINSNDDEERLSEVTTNSSSQKKKPVGKTSNASKTSKTNSIPLNIGGMSKKKGEQDFVSTGEALEVLSKAREINELKLDEKVRHNKWFEKNSDLEYNERKRHNETMEKIENEKLESIRVQQSRDRLQYKMELLASYEKAKLKFSDQQILLLFPEMKEIVELIRKGTNEEHSA